MQCSTCSLPKHCYNCYKPVDHIRVAAWQNQQNDWVPSEDSDQPGHPPIERTVKTGHSPSLIESSLSAQWVAKDPSVLHADSEDPDQTGRMPRLIWVFTGRTCHFVGFVMRWLNFFWNSFCRMWKFDTKDVGVRAHKTIFHRTNQKAPVDADGWRETEVNPTQSLDRL